MSSDNLPSVPERAGLAPVPDFMKDDGAIGTENMTRYIQPPRLLIVQPTSKEPLNQHDIGTPLIMPNEQIAGEYDKKTGHLKEPLVVVPVFFWPEFTLDNPRSIWSTHGAVRERSFDPDSAIAKRSQNPSLRETTCPDDPQGKMMKYQTRLNFLLWIPRPDINTTVVVQFKSSEYRAGMNFNSLIKARRRAIFGCQFVLDVANRKNEKGNWYGFNFANPPTTVGPWITDPEVYAMLKEEHLKMTEAHKAQALVVDDVVDDSEPNIEFEG